MLKITLKTIFFLFLVATAAVLIDFKKLELKTVIPQALNERAAKEEIIRSEEFVSPPQERFEGTEEEIIQLANQARRTAGLPELSYNEKLHQSALAKAEDMKAKGYFEHVSPEGLQPWFFAEQVGYNYKTFGENLAEGFFSARSVHQAWMNSEGHRENILSKSFSEIGVAIVAFEQNGLKSYLIVQHFGTQLKEEDLKSSLPETVCDKQVKRDCKDAKKKKKEIEEAIDEQEKIIKEAREAGIAEEDIKEAEKNLEKLKEIKKEIKKYLKECEDFIKKCDRWK